MHMLSNMARAECTDQSCFALGTAELRQRAERGDQSAINELERRSHNRRHAYFQRATARGESATDPGVFVPPSQGGPVRSPHNIPSSTFPEDEIQGVMRILKVPREKAIQMLQKCEMQQRGQGGR